MKKKIFTLLVLLMTAATGAWAQSTYKVTVKEGTEDATNWTITPNPATAGTQVKATYGGTKRVKSVKAVNPLATPLTIEALVDNSSITVSNPKSGMKYSTDGGITKTPVSGDAITLEKAGDKVQFYGTAATYGEYPWTTIDGSGSLKVYGNIMSLVDENNFATNTTLTAYCTFSSLFNGNTSLTDASGLLLPATTLTESCYECMFIGCTSLVAGPNLPATTLQLFCYASMFNGCTSLVAGPNLPATTLKEYCYDSMFSGCRSLVVGPTLPATTLTEGCYNYMFSHCESLTSLTCLATNISASGCISNWLDGVTTTGTLYVDESMKEKIWNIPDEGWSVVAKP